VIVAYFVLMAKFHARLFKKTVVVVNSKSMIKLYQNSKNIPLLIFLALCLNGCKSSTNLEIPTPSEAITPTGLDIQTFEKWPEEIEGCSCYFAKNEKEFKEGKYIYLDDLGELAFMRINGSLEKFKLLKREATSTSSRAKKIWTNNNYELIIKQSQTSQTDETWQQKGQMILKLNNGKEFRQNIYGECGC
jgi:hypothetical protein